MKNGTEKSKIRSQGDAGSQREASKREDAESLAPDANDGGRAASGREG